MKVHTNRQNEGLDVSVEIRLFDPSLEQRNIRWCSADFLAILIFGQVGRPGKAFRNCQGRGSSSCPRFFDCT